MFFFFGIISMSSRLLIWLMVRAQSAVWGTDKCYKVLGTKIREITSLYSNEKPCIALQQMLSRVTSPGSVFTYPPIFYPFFSLPARHSKNRLAVQAIEREVSNIYEDIWSKCYGLESSWDTAWKRLMEHHAFSADLQPFFFLSACILTPSRRVKKVVVSTQPSPSVASSKLEGSSGFPRDVSHPCS